MEKRYESMPDFMLAMKGHSEKISVKWSGHGYAQASLLLRDITSSGCAVFRVVEWGENGQGLERVVDSFEVMVKVE